MPNTHSIMGLHLRYRLWIAELNSDITVLRIFTDYLDELKIKKTETETKSLAEGFKKRFTDCRKEIDDLRHQMHLLKMKLAADSREKKQVSSKNLQTDNHPSLKKNYQAFRKSFDLLKKEFIKFEETAVISA